MNDLSHYLYLIKRAFYVDTEVHGETTKYLPAKSFWLEFLELKAQYEVDWKQLQVKFRALAGVRVRDITFAGTSHSFICIFQYADQFGKYSGFFASISILAKAFGFYHFKLYRVDDDEIVEERSYDPFDTEMAEKARMASELIKVHFPRFECFDQSLAGIKVEKVTMEFTNYQNVDLWQILFTSNIDII